MKNILIIAGGIIAYLFFSGKAKSLFGLKETDSLLSSDQNKETVQKKEIVREAVKNNLGMEIPDLNYAEKSIEYLRTNPKYNTVSEKNIFDIIDNTKKTNFVTNTRTTFSIAEDKLTSAKKLEEVFSRFSTSSVAPTLEKFRNVFKPQSYNSFNLY